jgi:hypothetical protein
MTEGDYMFVETTISSVAKWLIMSLMTVTQVCSVPNEWPPIAWSSDNAPVPGRSETTVCREWAYGYTQRGRAENTLEMLIGDDCGNYVGLDINTLEAAE